MEKVEQQFRKRKSKIQACEMAGHQQAKRIPIVRIVQIFSPVVVQTDEANFCSLVQQLTGLHSTIAMPASEETRGRKRTKVSAFATTSTDTKSLKPTFSDSISDNVSQLSALTAAADEEADASRTWDVCVPLDILSDASHSDDFVPSTSTELQDVSTADLPAIPDVSRSTEQLELLPSYLQDTLSPTTSDDVLQDEALSGGHVDTLLWSPLGDETFQTFYELNFSCGYHDCSGQTTTQ